MNRAWGKLILLASILGLCLYSQHEYGKRHSSIPEIEEEPDRFENVSFRSEGRARNVTVGQTTSFALVVMGDSIDAFYDRTVRLKDGDRVIVYGILHMKKGYLQVTQMHIYKDIRRLYVLSAVGLVVVLYLFLRDWTVDRLQWRRRLA